MIADSGYDDAPPNNSAGFAEISLCCSVKRRLSAFQLRHLFDIVTNIVRMGDVDESHRGKFIRRVTDHIAKRRIDFVIPVVRSRCIHTDVALFKDFTESFLTLQQLILHLFALGDVKKDSINP